MKIKIDSNFGLYGFHEESEIHLDGPRVTLGMVLEELAERSAGRINFIDSSTGAVDSLDFVLKVNGLLNSGSKKDLEANVNEGAIVSVKITLLDGGRQLGASFAHLSITLPGKNAKTIY
ncbi:MAG: hypothetical protein A2170_03020 [Deltaproteobacteria bacterium RBG_13_53_10]|nr:MAG: hypothetical protein A2170_03020 [Deltaproteobacteria bacterium RBG_13_53_10]